ncbi:MAG: peptidoglycan-binding domain-containing protein [Yoonia sp.]
MIRFIALAVLAVFINVTNAVAQPVLTNGGFEQGAPNTYGNHISWSIAPWILTSGSTNVVGVDGPGGLTSYGNSGPHSDATGGTGNMQHYLDQAGTAGTIYQTFTPLCTGQVRYGAYFSTRDGSGGNAQVTIKDSTGVNTIAGPASINLPAGDSENDPWQLSAFTANLTSGTTYRFEIYMDNNLNMDNAYVVFGPECTLHDSPDWSDTDDDPEPIPDPDPVPVQCSPFTQQDVTCNTTTGTYEVTISNGLSGVFNPTDISVMTTMPGVTITQNPLDQFTLLVTGATPGQVIPISTEAIAVGAGAGDGLDLCCNGEMEITIPDGELCEIIEEPDVPVGDPNAPLDVSIEKTWQDVIPSQVDAGSVPHGFEVVVNLEAGQLQAGDVITVSDPATTQYNVTSFGAPLAPAPWVCTQTGNSWGCSYVVPANGAALPVTITWPSIIDTTSYVQNCADVSVVRGNMNVGETSMDNNSSCWVSDLMGYGAPEPVEFNLIKECDPIVAIQGLTGPELSMDCRITVQPLTPAGGNIFISDVASNLSGGGQGGFVSTPIVDPTIWTCDPAIGSSQNCLTNGATYPNDNAGNPVATTIGLTLTMEDTGGSVTWQNCVGGIYAEHGNSANQTLNDYCVQETYVQCVPVPEIPNDMIDNDCDGDVDESLKNLDIPQDQPDLTLTKTSLGACRINERAQTYSCDFALIVNNATPDVFNGPVNIRDIFGSPTPRGFGNVQGDGWDCLSVTGAGEVNCLAPDLLVPAGDSATLEMTLTIPGLSNGGSFENCAGFALPENSVIRNKILQSLLNNMGIDVGTVDGIVGANTRAGILQLQQQENWPETSEASDAMLTALGLGGVSSEQVCITVNLPPMPEPSLSCDPATSVLIDGACECRFSRMMQSSSTSCSCISGTEFAAGQGCIRPQRQTSTPTPSRPAVETLTCPSGSTYNASLQACVAPQPQRCRLPNQTRVNGNCVCDPGFVRAGAHCVRPRSDSRDTP